MVAYKKILIPSGVSGYPYLPAVVVVDTAGTIATLRAGGFTSYGNDPRHINGKIYAFLNRFEIEIAGHSFLLDSYDPIAPPTWWDVVDQMDGCVVLLVVEKDSLDLAAGQQRVIQSIEDLAGSPRTAYGLIEITNELPQ